MAIPQINTGQVEALEEVSTGVGGCSLPVPDSKKDSYEKYQALTAELCDLTQLVILGLLKEITDQCGDKLATMYAMSNRNFRIFEITAIGRKLFDGVKRTIQ
jgi:hypothetical protein